MDVGVYAGLARRPAHVGQVPTAPVCNPPQVPFFNSSTQKWSCETPLVESHPILAVLLVAGFAVVFMGVLAMSVIFPGEPAGFRIGP